jgi:hypothetical protein
VALVLALLQGATSILALATLNAGRTAILVSALACLGIGGAVIALLERPAVTTSRGVEAQDSVVAVRE